MSAFWVTFSNHHSMCVEGRTAEAVRDRASTVGEISAVDRLPYPANPRKEPHEKYELADGTSHTIPAFCFRPTECKGHTSCPRNYSCTE